MVLPVVNIKSRGVGGGEVQVASIQNSWVEMRVRQADTSCSFLKHSQSDCKFSKMADRARLHKTGK